MPLIDELHDIVGRAREAANRAPGPRRVLAANSRDERLRAILKEIEETVLPRQLTFTLGANRRLVVEAGDSKLRAVVSVEPDQLAETDIGVERTASRDRQRVAALAVLGRFAGGAGELSVTPAAPVHFKTMTTDGLTAEDILSAQGLVLAEEAPEPEAPARQVPPFTPHPAAPPPGLDTPAGAFYAAAAAFAATRAVTAADGGLADKSGDDQAIPLEYLLRAFAAQIQVNAAFADVAMPGPRAIYMGSQSAKLPSVICFDDGGDMAVATLATEQPEQALDSAASILASMTPEA